MVTDYDAGDTAERYTRTATIPVRSRIEAYTFLSCIGDVTGLRVLDVACGSGHYTRLLARSGARVSGFDISARMIALARAQEARAPLGIDYTVADARAVLPQSHGGAGVDVAVAAYLLVYARDRDELARMCRGLASRVRPGGRFVTLTTNPDLYVFDHVPDYRKYGFAITLADTAYEGAPIELTVTADDGQLVIENYYLPVEAYASALADAGFGELTVYHPCLSPAPGGVDEGEFWDDYLRYPPAVVMECVRQ